MQITVKSVNVEWIAKGKTKYGKAVVSYVRDGKDNTQTLVSFKNPDVFKTLSEASEGSVYEITLTKEGDYWQWSKAVPADNASTKAQGSAQAPAATGGRVTGSNYETKEEREKKQVYIVKQSSLSAAISTLSHGTDVPLDPSNVIALARQYTEFVFESFDKDAEQDLFKQQNDI